jgi:outer membrane protein
MIKIKSLLMLLIILAMVMSITTLHAQPDLTIGIIKDASSKEFDLLCSYVKIEILALSKPRFAVSFKEVSADWQSAPVKQSIDNFLTDPEINLIVTLGFLSSNEISKKRPLKKPVIAATILDKKMQKLPLRANYSTGINNYSYIEPVIHLLQDMLSFSKMFEINQLAILIPKPLLNSFPQLTQYFNRSSVDFGISIIPVGDNIEETLSQIQPEIDAALVLPLIHLPAFEIKDFFKEMNSRHIPTLAVSGIEYLNMGATVTLTPQFGYQQLARQVALRVLKMSEGTNLSEIPVSFKAAERAAVVNMASLRLLKKFPDFNILNESILINIDRFPGKEMTLRMAIADALENNLQGKMAQQNVEIADKDIRIAKSNMFPHADLSANGTQLSENLVESSMGQKGEFTATGSASLKQVIFSEPVFANIAIKNLVAENEKYSNEQTLLDIVSNVTNVYISLLFSKSNLQIQSENVHATKQNLQIAKSKEEAGQSGISDVNRWTSELNLNKIKMNDAYSSYRATMYQLNNQLNSVIGNSINIPDSNTVDKTIVVNQNILSRIFEDPQLTEKYSGFIVAEMRSNSPELLQLKITEKILERQKTLHKRQLFFPEIAAFANVDQVFIREGRIENPQLPIPPPSDDPTWYVGLSLSIPLFEGGRTVTEVQRSNIELSKIANKKEELLKTLETGIRSTVQRLRTSYLELELSKNAALAAEDNFKVVQDAYSQGLANLVQLVDAQNIKTQTKHFAAIAYYQYVLDYNYIERLQGKFIFLKDKNEQQVYSNRLQDFLVKDK